ncbi:nicotinate-nucleotide pyrophosphorylase [Anopheles sinensis]|uniref:Nicotinate-nucleotide pyrophosphorylase n=1 Tax=Anopheles sinensis TaxID=74873 RepID=A0A084VRW9_ANOSI|nr:nicotinate-nucleotide pyrophosphorylase [Anopheles sinensis]
MQGIRYVRICVRHFMRAPVDFGFEASVDASWIALKVPRRRQRAEPGLAHQYSAGRAIASCGGGTTTALFSIPDALLCDLLLRDGKPATPPTPPSMAHQKQNPPHCASTRKPVCTVNRGSVHGQNVEKL